MNPTLEALKAEFNAARDNLKCMSAKYVIASGKQTEAYEGFATAKKALDAAVDAWLAEGKE